MAAGVVAVALLASCFGWGDAFSQRQMMGFPTYGQTFADGYNPIKWTGGLGPYSNRQAVGISREPPAGCKVDQVIMLHRHGTRYPDGHTGSRIESALGKVKELEGNLTGSLAFANDWEYFVPDPGYYQLEIPNSPYSGLGEAYRTGGEYAVRYGHLWDKTSMIPFFAGGYARVLETGRYFAHGFTGYNYTDLAAVQVIDETKAAGANSVAPQCSPKGEVTSCKADGDSFNMAAFSMPEFRAAAKRLNKENPGLKLDSKDILYLLMGSAFEISARGDSPWLKVFTNEEYVAFEYAMGLFFYCNFGPLSENYGMPIGSVYANATLTLLNQDKQQNGGSLFFSFSHDSYITAALAAFGALVAPEDPALDQVDFDFLRYFKISDVVPMGARLTIERLQCNPEAVEAYGSDSDPDSAVAANENFMSVPKTSPYVRLVLNKAVVPYDGCTNGPGWSCPLGDFTDKVRKRISKYDYVKDCRIPDSAPQYLDFFWNWNKTTKNNFHNGTWGYQATYVDN